MSIPTRIAWLSAMLLTLAACASPVAAPTQPAADSITPSHQASHSEEGPVVDDGAVTDALLDEIVADAEKRTGLTEGVEVVEAKAVTWNDGSLGCPEPGQMYTQALVDGFHVIVRAGDQELDYRGTAGSFRLCENPDATGGTKPTG